MRWQPDVGVTSLPLPPEIEFRLLTGAGTRLQSIKSQQGAWDGSATGIFFRFLIAGRRDAARVLCISTGSISP